MKRISPQTLTILLVDLALLVVAISHLWSLAERPSAPFHAKAENGEILIDGIGDSVACPVLRVDDHLLRWNDTPFCCEHDPEFLADFQAIGDPVKIRYRRLGVEATTDVELIPFYSLRYIIIVFVIGLVTWAVGVYVVVARPKDHTAFVLHSALVCLATAIIATTAGGDPSAHAGRAVYFFSYMGVATFFLYFTFLFPKPSIRPGWKPWLFIFVPPFLLTGATFAMQLVALRSGSPLDYRTFQGWFDWYHYVIFGYAVSGIISFLRSYRRTVVPADRKKLQWILLGLTLGPMPFLLLTVIPNQLKTVEMIPEEFTEIFLVIIPITFAISFVKYHVLNIGIVLNRTTVYGIAISGLVLTYAILIGIITRIGGGYVTPEWGAAAAILVALLFEPVRKRVQHFVDRKFFRVDFDFRQAVRRFVDEMKACVDVRQLAHLMVRRTDELIPVERIGFFALRQPGNRLYTVAHKNYELFERRTVRFEAENLKTRLELPVALDDKMEPGIRYESADARVFRRWGMGIVFPMLSQQFDFLGFLVLGFKKSGLRFSSEEVDLLNTVSTQAGLELDRIRLQQQLAAEQAKVHVLEELNELKSEFVSYVSHELRNPIASIMLFADLTRTRATKGDKKTREFLEIIGGEAGRLERMVATILDSTKVERGVMSYQVERADLGVIATEVIRIMRYQLRKHRFSVRVVGMSSQRRFPIEADPDAVKRAMINIIDNAIKYSTTRRYLKLGVSRKGKWVVWSAEDRGLGMSRETAGRVFDRFYRDPNEEKKIEGVGLGLPLVKHIVEWHGGNVEVDSKPGKGTRFRLSFPIMVKDHAG
jgi:signal transduction histidine kinase